MWGYMFNFWGLSYVCLYVLSWHRYREYDVGVYLNYLEPNFYAYT